ncbi:hypothetical protein TrVE_jg13804 [Triparma verrucosa]|uniref:Uncharacterized protein n=1 Tax=Triparma verrucosa TaxID=1606542 RepID=A0A9W7C666_9STRA|nr:hypothetical protein TrVE_jg13804 [Triparma verrucosa]
MSYEASLIVCDLEEDKTPYDLQIRVRLVTILDQEEYNYRLGNLVGPLISDPKWFVIDLDPGEYDTDGVGERVKVPGFPLIKFEIVGKNMQRKAILSLLENEEHRYDVLKIMINAGCSIKERYPDVDNGNVLFFAAFGGKKEVCKVLIELGAEINVHNDNGWGVVMIAASMGKSNAMRCLIEHGADMEVRNDAGWTALLVAANAGKPKAVKMLLLMGADATVTNNYGKNAYDLALDSGHTEVCKILEQNGLGESKDKIRIGDAKKLLPHLDARSPEKPPRRRGSVEGRGEEGGGRGVGGERGGRGRGGRGRRGGRRRSFAGMPSTLSAGPPALAPALSTSPLPTTQQGTMAQSQSQSTLPPLGSPGIGGFDSLDSHLVSSPSLASSPLPSTSVVDDSASPLSYIGNGVRRAPEAQAVTELRERRARESSVEYQRTQRELERIELPEDQRHKKKFIDKEAYLGNYTKDRSRRRSF